MPLKILTLAPLLFLFACSEYTGSFENHTKRDKSDSLVIEDYMFEVRKMYVEGADTLSREQVDSIFYSEDNPYPSNFYIHGGRVVYSPDNSFKIFTVETEGCGSYCNPDWYSWIHYGLKQEEKVNEIGFQHVDSIYLLPDGRYLLINSSWGRPASVYTVMCSGAKLLSFPENKDSFYIEAIPYTANTNYSENEFGFCQENNIDMEESPYITYSEKDLLLKYRFGNNYAYSKGMDIDSIRQGSFEYQNGRFVLLEETIEVKDRTDSDKGRIENQNPIKNETR